MGNTISIDKKILKWEWWKSINTFRLFIYMLLIAYEKDGFYKEKPIPRGSFPSSVLELSNHTGLTENEVRTSIKHLKSTGEITSKSQGKFSIFTIKKYNLYQSNHEQKCNEITSKLQTGNKHEKVIKKDEKKDTYLEHRKQIIGYFNQKCGTEYRFDNDTNKRVIDARLKEGYKVEDFIKVVDKKYDQWHGTEREQYLRPETLFGMKFDGYLNQKINKKNSKPQQQSGFNNFPQRQYDFEQLERELTGQGLEGG